MLVGAVSSLGCIVVIITLILRKRKSSKSIELIVPSTPEKKTRKDTQSSEYKPLEVETP